MDNTIMHYKVKRSQIKPTVFLSFVKLIQNKRLDFLFNKLQS